MPYRLPIVRALANINSTQIPYLGASFVYRQTQAHVQPSCLTRRRRFCSIPNSLKYYSCRVYGVFFIVTRDLESRSSVEHEVVTRAVRGGRVIKGANLISSPVIVRFTCRRYPPDLKPMTRVLGRAEGNGGMLKSV
jgi:hypothetical protein